MKKIKERILVIMLVIAMTITLMPVSETEVYAATSAQGSTTQIDDPEEATVNGQVYFTSNATGKIITLNGVENQPIDCNSDYDVKNIPQNGLFTIYYGNGTTAASQDKTVVNFTNSANNTSWKADNDKVFQMGKRTNPSGWESVMMEAQGDGTVCFKSCANSKYFTLSDGSLGLVDLKSGESPSSNEKFVMHTSTKPKTAKEVTISNITGDGMTVSWKGVDKCLYSGYEVMYSTSEDGNYTVAGKTKNLTFDITGLELKTKYFVKVRTVTNNESDMVYADSKMAYETTLNDRKPTVPDNLVATYSDNEIEITWDKSANANKYDIYKAESRFGTYEKVGTTTRTTYIDNKINTKSKYSNYYKIKGSNDSLEGEYSEPCSLETTMFGKNMYIFADTDDQAEIDKLTESIYEKQHYSQFGDNRYALCYKEGEYLDTKNPVNIGYYTQVLGLGKTPTKVGLANIKTPAALSGNNATCNFWVGAENLSIRDLENNDDTFYSFQWGVSQAAPARRLNVERKASFDWYYGYASGGFVADSYFSKSAGSFSQQQYYTRNCYVNDGFYGVNWNNVIQGCEGITAENTKDNSGNTLTGGTPLISGLGNTNWNLRGCTTLIEKTPVDREKPFLYFDKDSDSYKVFIPALRKNSTGVSWSDANMGAGTSISVDKYFYIANPQTDTAQTINKQLKDGKNIIFQPGVYHVSEPIKVTKSNTVLLGLGLASIIPDNSEAAIVTSDVGGIEIAGLILDAGNYSKSMLKIGKEGDNKDHTENPIVIHDVFFRVGGTGNLGRADQCLEINSNDTIIDHTWIWRADHGDHTGWYQNTSKNGLIVNGNNVTAYGLFVEHFQEYDIIWRGENGSTYFLQNEKCYDPQDQTKWMSHDGTVKGYAAYKVANNVKKHYAVGLGIYDVFINTNGANIHVDSAIEVPDNDNVIIENACTVEIASSDGPSVGIDSLVNSAGPGIKNGTGSSGGYAIQRLLSYQNTKAISLGDYYTNSKDTTQIPETVEQTSDDTLAEKDIKKDSLSKDVETPIWDMTDDLYQEKLDTAKKDDPVVNPPIDNPSDVKKPVGTTSTKLKKGSKFTVGKLTFKISKISGKKGKVAITTVKKKYRKKLRNITVKATVKYKGYTFKITEIKAKAFKNSKKLKKITVKGSNLTKVSKTAFYKKVRKKIKIKAKKKVKKVLLKSLKRKK